MGICLAKASGVELQQSTKHIWWLTYANGSEKRSNAVVKKLEMIKK